MDMHPNTLEEAFAAGEADRYFDRNRHLYEQREKTEASDDLVNLLKIYQITPSRIFEMGCANGYRLNFLHDLFKAESHGVDISKAAIEDGKAKYPHIYLKQASAGDLSTYTSGSFDLVLSSGVFCIIDRQYLLNVASELDRLLKDGGFMIMSEVNSVTPSKIPYHHVQGANLFTYKQDYTQMFLASNLYYLVHQSSYHFDKVAMSATNDYQHRYTTWILRKDLQGLYYPVEQNPSLNA